MDRQLKQQFTLRITQANKTELCVILYEMFMTYCSDAICNQEQGDLKEFRLNIQRARGCLKELMGSLHFEYEFEPLSGFKRHLMDAYITKECELPTDFSKSYGQHLANIYKNDES